MQDLQSLLLPQETQASPAKKRRACDLAGHHDAACSPPEPSLPATASAQLSPRSAAGRDRFSMADDIQLSQFGKFSQVETFSQRQMGADALGSEFDGQFDGPGADLDPESTKAARFGWAAGQGGSQKNRRDYVQGLPLSSRGAKGGGFGGGRGVQ